ncbi:aflatoxin biosynthesis ketoreductase nor-1 [Viridothelium virens]|uniref:Aflatoxin biosynthesis ketoreductase nor-1 n=1 Tax=Viridothelium virens TaxID=1048519 RepID=A0A6A6GU80_VIRVR|nr:aflatoxin biosynthesis ketoreductase nor-1 [Viridothelium virens]
MSSPTIYFVTGGNRGLGRGLVAHYLLQPSTLVVAGVRDPSNPTSKSLSSLPTASGSKLVIVSIGDTSKAEGIQHAISELRTQHSIDHIDIVIANAGMSNFDTCGPLHSLPISDLEAHIQTNTFGSVRLYQAAYPLLRATHEQYGRQPKFVAISALLGSLTYMDEFAFPQLSYCVSKTALNWLVRQMERETEWLCAYPLHPGWVETDMGHGGAKVTGAERPPTTLDESIEGMVKVIANTKRGKKLSPFLDWQGNEVAW